MTQRQTELQNALKRNLPDDKLNKFVEKYRLAQLSMLKAQIHVLHEKEYKTRELFTFDIEKLEKERAMWQSKTVEEILKMIEI